MKAIISALTLVWILTPCFPTVAQTINQQKFATDPDAPVEITSHSLNIDEGRGEAVFQGGPEMRQGRLKVLSQKITVFGLSQDVEQMERMRFEQNVSITSADGRVARGDWAEYVPQKDLLVMGDDVSLTQAPDEQGRAGAVLTGRRLEVDMLNGQSRLLGDAQTRAKGVLTPGRKSSGE